MLLAAAVALLAVRGAGRVVVGLLMAVAGGVARRGRACARSPAACADVAALPSVVGQRAAAGDASTCTAAWPVLAVVAGLLGVAAGLLVVLRGRGWPAMGRRYERPARTPAPRRGAPAARPTRTAPQAAWRALDRGEDPTEPDASDAQHQPGEVRGNRPRPGAPAPALE